MKRIVLEHTQDEWKGMHQIIGLIDALPPSHLSNFRVAEGPVIAFASLISVTPRFVLYREAFELPKGKLGEFHPEQI